jgi:hypothetical protein
MQALGSAASRLNRPPISITDVRSVSYSSSDASAIAS